MSLKSLLSASLLLLAALAAPAAAQQKAVEFRHNDDFRGPVKRARIETATFSRAGGALVEGPRRLVLDATYTPDGKRKEQQSYAPDGTLRARDVFVYDAAGREVELSMFDAKGDLQMRRVHRPATRETLAYGGDGSLRWRSAVTLRPDGTAETRVYDAHGALTERNVTTHERGVSVWSAYRPDGSLKREARYTPGAGGRRRGEVRNFAPDGSVVTQRVSDLDAQATDLRVTEDAGDGGPPRRTRETREYDSRRNLSRLVNFKWNAETGEFEPAAVTYYTITYYR